MKKRNWSLYLAIASLADFMAFYLTYSVCQCANNFIEIELRKTLLLSIIVGVVVALVSVVICVIKTRTLREGKIGFWLSKNYPKLFVGYIILVLALTSITKEAIWTADEINDVLTIEWTIFGLSLTVFLVWNVLIVEYLKKRKPERPEKPDFVQELALIMDKRSYNQEVESTFTHMVYLTINLFMLLFSSSFVYFSHLPNEVLTQNFVRCTFFFSTNTIAVLFMDILKPLKSDKKALMEESQITKSQLDNAQAKAIIQIYLETTIKRIKETECLSDEEKEKLIEQFYEETKAMIPAKSNESPDNKDEAAGVDKGEAN